MIIRETIKESIEIAIGFVLLILVTPFAILGSILTAIEKIIGIGKDEFRRVRKFK